MNQLTVPPPNSGPKKLSDQTPVTIFTGFLGSGKTTIISNLVDELQKRGEQISYIKNEEGEVELDAKMLGGKHIVAQELLNGCICCTLMGPFLDAVDEIIDSYHPDRIIVESSGTAEPGNMAITIGGHNRVFRDGIIEIVDVVNFGGYKEVNEYWQMQTNLTDLIVLNKAELVDGNQKELVINRVRDLNRYSPIVESKEGKIDSELVFGIASKKVDQLLEKTKGGNKTHQDHMDSFVYETNELLNQQKLEGVLHRLPESVVRYKGWVKLENEEVKILNGVFKRWEWFAIENGLVVEDTKLLFFGPGIDKKKQMIVEWMESCISKS